MKRRLSVILAVATGALTISATALAHDCIRVSSSPQGLNQSAAHSGNWIAVDMSASGGGVAEVLGAVLNFTPANQAQLDCIQAYYDSSGAPMNFALGIGVAGGDNHGPGVLAHNAPDKVLSNGTGIDHLDETVVPVLASAINSCPAQV